MKLAIIHTGPSTIDPLKTLAEELMPGTEIINIMDDSIVPQISRTGGRLDEAEKRLMQYANFAEHLGADIILNACSSVGEVVNTIRQQVSAPVVRIDEAMAEEAVRRAERIGVAATLETTLRPTLELLQSKAKEANKDVTFERCLVEGAFERLSVGDEEGHNRLLIEALTDLADRVEVIVLAQASMARVVTSLPKDKQEKVLSSPRLGMERVKQIAIEQHKI